MKKAHGLCMKIINKHPSFNDVESYLNEYYKDDDSTIVLGYLSCSFEEIQMIKADSKRLIIFQLEQISPHLYDMNRDWLSILFEADEIWDYNIQNAKLLKDEGLSVTKVTKFEFTKSLNKIKHKNKKDIDVLFYGSLNEKRLQILDSLSAVCNLKIISNAFADELDDYISRSKIVLNIHYYDMDVQEQVRIFYLLSNACCVISEFNTINNFDNYIFNIKREDIVKAVLIQLENDNYKKQMKLVKKGWMKCL